MLIQVYVRENYLLIEPSEHSVSNEISSRNDHELSLHLGSKYQEAVVDGLKNINGFKHAVELESLFFGGEDRHQVLDWLVNDNFRVEDDPNWVLLGPHLEVAILGFIISKRPAAVRINTVLDQLDESVELFRELLLAAFWQLGD